MLAARSGPVCTIWQVCTATVFGRAPPVLESVNSTSNRGLVCVNIATRQICAWGRRLEGGFSQRHTAQERMCAARIHDSALTVLAYHQHNELHVSTSRGLFSGQRCTAARQAPLLFARHLLAPFLEELVQTALLLQLFVLAFQHHLLLV